MSDLRWSLSKGDLYPANVRKLLLECMILASRSDGELEEAEKNIIGNI